MVLLDGDARRYMFIRDLRLQTDVLLPRCARCGWSRRRGRGGERRRTSAVNRGRTLEVRTARARTHLGHIVAVRRIVAFTRAQQLVVQEKVFVRVADGR